MLSRNIFLKDALIESKNPKFFEKMLDEFLKFNAGFDIEIPEVVKEAEAPFVPKVASASKSRQLLSSIKLASQQKLEPGDKGGVPPQQE